MGSAALRQLAGRGARVLGIEQFDVAHNRGSAHGKSRMIRLAYHEHPDYVPLLRRAFELWDKLSADAGEALLHRTGGLYMGRAGCGLVEGSLKSARDHGLPHEALDAAAVHRRFPQFRPPHDDAVAVFEPAAGFVLPERAILASVRLVEACGAAVRTGERVVDWQAGDDDGGGVTVITDRGRYDADTLILAGGAWLKRFCHLPALADGLRVSRQTLAWFEPLRDDLQPGQMPVWAIDRPEGGVFYGFPVHDDAGLKAAEHARGPSADPDALDRTARPEDAAAVRTTLDAWLPGAAGALRRQCACMYTNTPDGHFVLDRHPRFPQVLIASCCSGHGFKFAPVIGEILADLAMAGRTSLPIGLFSLSAALARWPRA